jgi:DNA-binding SARP family transcriptional activator/tetratricopeptide (TPR) repeat protein
VIVPVLSDAELEAISDPAVLLDRAWALEPPMRTSERTATLDRLRRLLVGGPAAPADRAWELELAAERAIDAARLNEPDRALELADEALAAIDAAGADDEIATVRALMARGRALAWMGTDTASRRADRVFCEVAERCRALGRTEWQGFAVFWRGQSVYFQNGDLRRGRSLMAEALEVLGPDSAYRSTVLTFYADALAGLGDWTAAEAALTEAADIADRDDDGKTRAYVAWGRAQIASARGDALATERLLREAERDRGDWFDSHTGVTFLAAGAEMLDRVGLSAEALGYLKRASARAPDDEFVRQARATLLARSGNPMEALEALQGLAQGMWLEKRHMWRLALLTAWATFRAGRDVAGELAARGLEQVTAVSGIEAALSAESELVLALAPLAEQAGSATARQLLLGERELLVRLFSPARVVAADGRVLRLPAGKPGELVRLLALHEHGLPVEVVLDEFFGETPPAAARQRLRQILTRLRAGAGELVIRDGEMLRLRPAWVDVREFNALADRVRTTRSSRAMQLAYGALALRTGPLLTADRYATWAEEIRRQVEYRYLALLDLVAADAAARGAHHEALTALDAALAQDPEDERRYPVVAEQLHALGRHDTAQYLTQRTGRELRE